MDNIKIAVINPSRPDGLARTILDGLYDLELKGETIDFKLSNKFDYSLPLDDHCLIKNQFVDYARVADLIFLIWDKAGTDTDLAKEINCLGKTIYIDGSELGKNRRYDFTIQKDIIDGVYSGCGGINQEMLKKCAAYFKREKPYSTGIEPLPFGIETRYLQSYQEGLKKDIDFLCIFGQDEYPLMRRYVRSMVEEYCRRNKLVCVTSKTKNPEEFYALLARSKVGVSVGGGGFDTLRFWEMLGNNCLLLTENIDIFRLGSADLDYKRIWQFGNLFDFQTQLEKVGQHLFSEYNELALKKEYELILKEHGSSARVKKVIEFAKSQGII